jgi:hypothetical protein
MHIGKGGEMKYFEPGMRVTPHFLGKVSETGQGIVVLCNKVGYVRRRWWGAIQFTKEFDLATKWNNSDEAVAWAKEHGLN